MGDDERRREVLGQIGDIETRLLTASRRFRDISLKSYISSLQLVAHSDYDKKDNEMPDCPICLITFVPTDELMVY